MWVRIPPPALLSKPSGGDAREALVDLAHHCRALADRSGAALGGAGADVAGGVDPRDAGLEHPFRPRLVARADEAVGAAGDRVADPVRARVRSDEEEEVAERDGLAVL